MAELSPAPATARLILRGRAAELDAAEVALGFALPREACRSAGVSGRHALWLGPDEWLLLAPVADVEALTAMLEATTAQAPHALVDVSQRQIGLTLAGPDVEELLAAGCPLDLDLTVFPVGMCARTVLAKAEIVLWRTDEAIFHIEIWRSFSAYVRGILEAAGATVS